MLENKLKNVQNLSEKKLLETELRNVQEKRHYLTEQMTEIVSQIVEDVEMRIHVLNDRNNKLTRLDCHHQVTDAFNDHCFSYGKNPYAWKFGHVFVNLCVLGLEAQKIASTLESYCAANIRFDGIY